MAAPAGALQKNAVARTLALKLDGKVDMAKTLKDRARKLREGIGEHFRKYMNAEVTAGDALKGVRKDMRHFLKKVRHGGSDDAHKDAVRYTKYGVARYNAGEYAEAEEMFRRAIETDPKYARAHYDLGNTCYQRGHLTEAVTAWNQAIEADPWSEVAGSAREKLQYVGHGAEGIVSTIKDQMLHRR